LNIPTANELIIPGTFLRSVLHATSPEERENLVETSEELEAAYIPIALQGQTTVSEDWMIEPPYHYVTFADVQGELNGGREGAVDRGVGRSFIEVVRERVQQPKGSCSLLASVQLGS
jgi:ubiquitin carboxyl-terminal hydrolase L3